MLGLPGFLAAYETASLGQATAVPTDWPGHADISLEPLVARYAHLRRGYLIELKYLKRGESAEQGSADQGGVEAAVREATAQLARYLADERLARQYPGVRFIGLAVVFHGWEMVFCNAVSG